MPVPRDRSARRGVFLASALLAGALAGCSARPQPRLTPAELAEISEPAPGPTARPLLARLDGQPSAHVFGGTPIGPSDQEIVVLVNSGYAVGYSETRRNPLWGAYRLPSAGDPVTHPRPSRFRIDDRTTAQVSHDCLTGSGYDRGHIAPNYAIDTRYGRDAQRETFVMSNVSPQTCNLNREPWEGLEKLEAQTYASDYDTVWVVAGPIFGEKPEALSCDVEVPVAFYRVIVENSTGSPRALAVVMAQEDRGKFRQVSEFVTTVDCIETLTGLDLFPALDDIVEAQIESVPADDDWNLATTLTPSRSCAQPWPANAIEAGNQARAAVLAACSTP